MTFFGLAHGSLAVAQDEPDDVVVIDGTMWSLVTGSEPTPWNEANEFCETLQAGGYSDWRLPTLFELEALHDETADDSVRGPFALDDCCAWSSMNLTDLEPGTKGQLPPPSGPPAGYYWGFLFAGGISYYSNGRFADGFAMCLRDPGAA
jgi:hypothetical protein